MGVVEVTDAIISILNDAIAANELDVERVFRGDQDVIMRRKIICIEPVEKTNELYAAQRFIQSSYKFNIICYVGTIQSTEDNSLEADVIGEIVEKIIHSNPTLRGTVLHSFISSFRLGYVTKDNSVSRTCILVLDAVTEKYKLP